MFELIIEQVPELRKLERAVEALQQEHGEASARVQGLAHKVAQARAIIRGEKERPGPPVRETSPGVYE